MDDAAAVGKSSGAVVAHDRPSTCGIRVGGILAAAIALGLLPPAGFAYVVLALITLGTWAAIQWYRRFDLLLHVLVLSVFVESVGVGPVRVGRLLAVIAVVALITRALLTPWRPRLTRPPGSVLPVALLMLWAWASGFWSSDTSAWAYAMGQLALAMAYFITFTLIVERREQIRELLQTMLYGAMFASVVAFAQIASGEPRAEGLQGDPNIYALYQVASLPAAVLVATSGPAGRRWLGWAAIPLLLGSVVATQSRGGLATALAVIVLMVARGDVGERLKRHRMTALSAVVCVAVIALAAVTTLNKRFAPERVLDDRASGRLDIWYVAFREWQDHPLLGIGAGGFKPRSVDLLLSEPGVQLLKSHLLLSSGIEVHNIYLETLVEYGVIGWLAFLLVLISTGLRLQRAGRHSGDPVLRALPTMLFAFLAASFSLSVVNNKLLWFLIALGVVVAGPAPSVRTDTHIVRRPPILPRHISHLGPLLLTVVMLPTTVAVGTTVLASDRYTSSVLFVVNPGANGGGNEPAVETLAALAVSRVVAEDVLAATRADLTPEEFLNRMSVDRPEGALSFELTVADVDAQRSAALVRGLAQALPARVAAVQASAPTELVGSPSLRLWGSGAVSTTMVPRPILLGAGQGLTLGAALALLLALIWSRENTLATSGELVGAAE